MKRTRTRRHLDGCAYRPSDSRCRTELLALEGLAPEGLDHLMPGQVLLQRRYSSALKRICTASEQRLGDRRAENGEVTRSAGSARDTSVS